MFTLVDIMRIRNPYTSTANGKHWAYRGLALYLNLINNSMRVDLVFVFLLVSERISSFTFRQRSLYVRSFNIVSSQHRIQQTNCDIWKERCFCAHEPNSGDGFFSVSNADVCCAWLKMRTIRKIVLLLMMNDRLFGIQTLDAIWIIRFGSSLFFTPTMHGIW